MPPRHQTARTGHGASRFKEIAMSQPTPSRLGSIILLLLAFLSVSGCNPYGGPYYIGGDTKYVDEIMANNKNAEFTAFKNKLWKSSKVAKLVPLLFKNSIIANSKSKVPDADKIQQYNYVIKGNDILVAVWDGDIDSLNQICEPGLPYPPMTIQSNTMVNFYPESNKQFSSDPNCISTLGNNRETGVLDAHSKHFLLVQGVGTKISDYDYTKSWEKKTVDYAGEIVVVLKASSCYYRINGGSGTYKPKAGRSNNDFEYLQKVAELFAKETGVSPEFAWRTDPDAHWFILPPPATLCP
jgi:hypothetical protein